MSVSYDDQITRAVVDQLRNQSNQASWATDPVGWARDVLGVHLWSKQIEVCDSLRDNKKTVVTSCHGTGKALELGVPVAIPGGFKPMGDIVVGDDVVGADGSPTRVLAVTGAHRREMYRIVFVTPGGAEDSILCSGEHLWPVIGLRGQSGIQTTLKRRNILSVPWGLFHHLAENITAADMFRRFTAGESLLVPGVVPTPLVDTPDFPDWLRALFHDRGEVDPYGRAALRWDGSARAQAPVEQIAAIRSLAREVSGHHTLLYRERTGPSYRWSLGFPAWSAAEGLWDQNYESIARSAYVDRHPWEFDIQGDGGHRVQRIEKVGEGDVQCIQVDAADSLYLCGESQVPTHNSMIASVLACWWVSTKPLGEAIVVSCYTDDTEVLTKDGWKLFKDVTTGPEGDEFATRNPETKAFEWQNAFRYYEAPWDGEVVDVRGRSLDLRVTPNHRMAVQWSTYENGVKTTGETFKRADAIGPRGAELPALSTWEGKTPETVTFGKHTWTTEDFAAFLGAWLAEGSLGPRRSYTKKGGYGGSIEGEESKYSGLIVLTQLPETKGYQPYQDLLIRMLGREPARSQGKNWSFACSDLYDYLEQLGKAHEKYIPADAKEWGPEALERLLEFYLLGDGWFQKSSGKRAVDGYGSWRACTVSKRLADDLQETAQKTGRSATLTERAPRDGGTFEGGRKILAENCRTGYYLIFGDSQTRRVKTSRSHYKGNVYCVSVPNETLYVRRGGSPIWCGNTAPTYAQVNKILWEEIRKHHATAKHRGFPLPGYVTQGDEWKTDDGRILGFGRKPATGDRHGFHGIHRRFVFALIDEACHDDQTDVLTESGWKRFKDVLPADRLLCMDKDTHEAYYDQPLKLIDKPYSGDMIVHEGKGMNYAVTPDHTMLYAQRGKNGAPATWRTREHQDMRTWENKGARRNIIWANEDIPWISDDFLALLGWFGAEGSLAANTREIRISQNRAANPENHQEIADLCARLGLRHTVDQDHIRIGASGLADLLRPWGRTQLVRRVPGFIRKLSARQITVYLDAYLKGDGYDRGNRKVIYTSSPQMADDLQELILKTGASSVVATRPLAGKSSVFPDGHTAVSTVDGYVVTWPTKGSDMAWPKQKNVRTEHYEGRVYCAAMPRDHLLFTRRGGYTMWSGNCGVPEEIWTGVEAITTTDRCRVLAIGNPDDRNTEFGKVFLKPELEQDWSRMNISAFDTPNLTGEEVPALLNEVLVSANWCASRKRDWGEGDARYLSKVLGVFPQESASSLISPALIAQAFDEVPPQSDFKGGVLRLGVDVARFGTDESVVVSSIGRTAKFEDSWGGTDTVSSAHRVLKIAEELKERHNAAWVEIRVDAVGLGAGVVDTLNARLVLLETPWYSVYEMHGSAAPPQDQGGSVHGYGNARAWWFDQLRTSIRNNSVKIVSHDGVSDDLGMIYYVIKSGKLFIISKEEMRAKHGRSPDLADALVYAVSPVSEGVVDGTVYSRSPQEVLEEEAAELQEDAWELQISPY
jgi:hypothetical protein